MRASSRYVRKTALFTCPIASTSRKRTCSRCTKSNPSTRVMLSPFPGSEQARFALGGEPRAVARLGLLERRPNRVGQRPKAEAGSKSSRDVRAVQSLVGLVLDPHRQFHPLPDLLVEQELAVDPDEPRIGAG